MPDAVFPSRRDEAAAPAGSALFFVLDLNEKGAPSRAPFDFDDEPAWCPPPSYSVIAWIRWVSSGLGGPLWSAMALVMSPWSLIFPAMNACMAACGLASTIIALAVS